VLPGRSACGRCVDLHRADRDPHWPSVAAGLLGRTGTASPATAEATAALVAEQSLLTVDALASGGSFPGSFGAELRLDLAEGSVRTRRWRPHPGCPCHPAVR
jgi:hypothetical protein